MSDTPTSNRIFVWVDDVTGSSYYASGHVDPEAFRLACTLFDITELDYVPEDGEGSAGMRLEDVRHEWWRQKHPDNDEDMTRCDPSDEGAEPFTAWRG